MKGAIAKYTAYKIKYICVLGEVHQCGEAVRRGRRGAGVRQGRGGEFLQAAR